MPAPEPTRDILDSSDIDTSPTPLIGASASELAAAFRDGAAVAPADLAGFAFRGVSLGLPSLVDRLLWKTFSKVFVATSDERVLGFNLRIVQTDDTVAPYRVRSRSPRFGDFLAISEGSRTLLDYGATHPRWHPLSAMRDRLVALGDDTFLGRADLAIAGASVVTPSYFTLRRARALPAGATHHDAHVGLSII